MGCFLFYCLYDLVCLAGKPGKPEPYHVIHFPLDDYIPFCEYFIIPYLLWFAYIAVVYVWLFFHDRPNFFRYIAFIYAGMTLFLIISTLYPNGHLLLPAGI